MKIDPNMMIGTVTGMRPDTKSPAAGGSSFETILKDMQDAAATQTRQVHPALQVGQPSPQKFNALNVSGQALDLLDAYARALDDPKLSLKDIAPMVDEMDAVRSAVAEARSFLSDDDPLKGIMADVESTLNSELVRFRRGDLIG
ncbi:MAG: hypothetical protein BWZ01_00253 [Deltaproteobacteria bacterium ADurb.BinA179]|jgi:hypothetical protein|nr:hypothetical protein [Deltaproteobacteria bacterium]MDI9542664.1 hypothetical protein [Pseudomonadota bacterium]NLW67254.1 hypothetical protein [Bacteriovoracaceae bacterium]OPZ29984.1 MAG: hypothetical protein BWZ01_00253 [Deltaproteobacteria bacterium ADurb.BinA179]HRR20093.1 hypothetical protein [Desulfomonilia bacterium]